MATEVRGLYLLARALGDDLARTGMQGGARLVAATAMGGGFASVPGASADFFAGHGGIAGLVKTLAREWSEVALGWWISTAETRARTSRRSSSMSF